MPVYFGRFSTSGLQRSEPQEFVPEFVAAVFGDSLSFFVYECIPNCPSCFPILCSEHRRHVQSTGCPADTRPGSKRSSSGPCHARFVSSQHMAGLCGTGWPSAHTGDICNGRSSFLNIHALFRCLSNHAVLSTAGAARRDAVPFVPRRRS